MADPDGESRTEGFDAPMVEDDYRWVMASDLDRDGMVLELNSGQDGDLLAEVFYSDQRGTMTLTVFDIDLPLAVIGELVARAKQSLPPTNPAC